MSRQRLDKIIASQGSFSRSEVRALCKKGRVLVNGIAVSDSGFKADPEADKITVDGKKLGYSEHIYIMLNKPKGVVSASNSPNDKTVIDLVPDEMWRNGLFPAGRLDKDTTGFVLITDDGDFAHEILSPKSHVEKTYVAVLDRPISAEKQSEFEKGVVLADGYECLPAKIRELTEDGLTVEIKLKEGKYHQIKRMAAACDSHVNELERIAIGALELDRSLDRGECRLLSDNEKALVKKEK